MKVVYKGIENQKPKEITPIISLNKKLRELEEYFDWVLKTKEMKTKTKYYTLKDADVTIKDGIIIDCTYDFENKNIIIPNKLQGQEVVGIGDYVFSYRGITNVQLPPTLLSIGEDAFSSNNLTEVTIPPNVTFIGGYAFEDNSLTEVTIPEGVSIGDSAFDNNVKITRV